MVQAGNADLDAIMLGLQAQIVANTSFTLANCFLSLNSEEIQYPSSDAVCVISPEKQEVQTQYYTNSLSPVIINGLISTTIHSRINLDPSGQDTSFLTDTTRGLFAQTLTVLNSLQGFNPFASDGVTPLLREPFLLQSYDKGVRKQESTGWGYIGINWLCQYNLWGAGLGSSNVPVPGFGAVITVGNNSYPVETWVLNDRQPIFDTTNTEGFANFNLGGGIPGWESVVACPRYTTGSFATWFTNLNQFNDFQAGNEAILTQELGATGQVFQLPIIITSLQIKNEAMATIPMVISFRTPGSRTNYP